MSDANKTDTTAGDGEQLDAKKQTLGQQLLIWLLVIMVGVLFGMGPALGIVMGGAAPEYAQVSQAEAVRYKNISDRLSRLLSGRSFSNVSWEAFAAQIHQAHVAEQEGLMPKGDTLKEVVNEFLATEIGDGRTQGDILQEYVRSDRGVTADELSYLLQHRAAVNNLYVRNITLPLVPDTVISGLKAVEGDRVNIKEVTLSTLPLADEFRADIAADDVAIQSAYDRLKEDWFRIPAKRTLTAFVVDPSTIESAVTVGAEAIKEYYDANKARRPDWELPPEEPSADDAAKEDAEQANKDGAAEGEEAPEEPPQPRYKPIEEVSEEITQILRTERAMDLAMGLYDQFIQSIRQNLDELAISTPNDLPREDLVRIATETVLGPDEHPHLSEPISVQVIEGAEIAAPDSGLEVTLLDYGSVRLAEDLFANDIAIGTIDEPTPNASGLGIMLRLEGKIDGSYQPLDTVRDDVVTWLAARAAWPKLLERAEAIASEAGLVGLEAWFGTEENQALWGATVASDAVPALTPYAPPPAEVDMLPGEGWPAIAMADYDRSVRVVAGGSAGGAGLLASVPTLRLVRVTAYEPAGDSYTGYRMVMGMYRMPKRDPDWLSDYRGALGRHLQAQLDDRLQQSMRGE